MARPVTLFTGQWADLTFDTVCAKAKSFGYDGVEIACWGDHFEVDKALSDDAYVRSRHDILAMFVRHGVTLAFTGVACGLAGAVVLTRLMESLLFGTSPLDLIIYVLVSVGLAGIAAVATYVPARHAARVDPVRTLRGE